MKSSPTSWPQSKSGARNACDFKQAFGAELRQVLCRAVREPDRRDIHAVRKGIITLRSWLRLVREPIGSRRYDRHNRRLRKAARMLAPMRDARGMFKAFETVSPGTLFPNTRWYLRQQERRAEKAAAAAMRQVKRGLEQELAASDRLPLEKISRPDFAAALERLREEMKAAFTAARASGSTEALHTWRKRAKNYLQSLALVGGGEGAKKQSCPVTVRIRKLLGQDHDLALLEAKLAARRDKPETSALLARIAARRAQLRRQLFPRPRRGFPGRGADAKPAAGKTASGK
jgi:hypothetical protein